MNRKKLLLLLLIAIMGLCTSTTANASKVALNHKNITMSIGNTVQLKVKGTKEVQWYSSNKSVVSVNKYGLVSGKRAGTATIKAKTKVATVKCRIRVKMKPGDLFPDSQPEIGEGNIELKTISGTSENGNIPVVYLPKSSYTTPASVSFYENESTDPFWFYLDGVLVRVQSVGYISSPDLYTEDYRGITAGTHRVDVVQYESADPTLPVVLHRVFYYTMIRT